MSEHQQGGEAATIEAGCHMLGIPLDPAWMEAIIFNLRVIARQSQALLDPAIADAIEPAPVFRA